MAGELSPTRCSRRMLLRATPLLAAGAVLAACGPAAQPPAAPAKPAAQATTPAAPTTAPAGAAASPAATTAATPAATGATPAATTAAAKPAATTAAAATPAAAPVGKTGVEVRFATDWTEGARGQTINSALPLFEKQNPDIKIKLEPIGGDYFDRLQVQFAGGTVADAILFEGVLAPEYIKEGLIADLSDTLKAQKIDESKWRPGVPEVFKQGGKVYAVPFQLTPIVWFYNKTLFQKMGAPTPDGTWDWAKTLEVAKQLTKPPESYGLWIRSDMFHQWGAMGLQNSNHHWTTPDATKTLIGEADFAEAIRWNIEAVHQHKVSPAPAETQGLLTAGVTNLFATGKIGMAAFNAGSIGSFRGSIADRFEWDLMPTPKAPGTKQGGGLWNDQPHVVTSNAQKRGVLDQATRLVVYLSSDEVQQIIAKDRGSTPTVKAIQESEAYLSPPPASMKGVIEELKIQKGPLFFTNFLEWFNVLNKEYERGLIGERSIEDTIKTMVAEGDKILAKK